MSGTSLDGIDVAAIKLKFEEQKWNYTITFAKTYAYSDIWKEKLGDAIGYSSEQIQQLNIAYTSYLAEVIQLFISEYSINNLDAICSHGHTIFHQPNKGITLQIGNLPSLAKLLKTTVVCDFRTQDVALGGQGAPLVPIGDKLLFSAYDYCLNLGGFANISFHRNNGRVAFDICPVNIVLNKLTQTIKLPYDDKGEIAKRGRVNNQLLIQLNKLPYYHFPPPKSLGLEWVQETVFKILNNTSCSLEDLLCTFTHHIANQISVVLEEHSKVLITGGGAFNTYLIETLAKLKQLDICLPDTILINYKEALIFGLLGVLKLRGEVNCLAGVTGAKQDHSSGVIYYNR
jgi:anhydro-N-acetylmuramic acid kinase